MLLSALCERCVPRQSQLTSLLLSYYEVLNIVLPCWGSCSPPAPSISLANANLFSIFLFVCSDKRDYTGFVLFFCFLSSMPSKIHHVANDKFSFFFVVKYFCTCITLIYVYIYVYICYIHIYNFIHLSIDGHFGKYTLKRTLNF